jgi:hypothetical protein
MAVSNMCCRVSAPWNPAVNSTEVIHQPSMGRTMAERAPLPKLASAQRGVNALSA